METPFSSGQNNSINIRGAQDKFNSISHHWSEQFPSGLSQSSSMVRGLYVGSNYQSGGSKHFQILFYFELNLQQYKQTIEKVLFLILGSQRYKSQCVHYKFASRTGLDSPSDQLDPESYQQNNQKSCECLTNNTGLVQDQVLTINNKCIEGIEPRPITSSTCPKQENAEQLFVEVTSRKHLGTTNDKSVNGEILYVNLLHLAGLTDDAIFQTLCTISFETWRKRRTALTNLVDYIETNLIDIELLLGESPDIQIVNVLVKYLTNFLNDYIPNKEIEAVIRVNGLSETQREMIYSLTLCSEVVAEYETSGSDSLNFLSDETEDETRSL
ncbi:MAG: hypothetical protein EZS28_002473 [Streblomastix strix]|uniref:Uncharacterized protein n=1 Tax=Streblomastix strix TaxID=222440 RepID=A0A5J4X4T7_9EUKA|nr:MAG: hypothetical protein EZS28_002473 [Streblomastix strix]